MIALAYMVLAIAMVVFFGSCLQVDNLAHWPARSDRPSRQVVANAVSALGFT